MFDLLLHFPFSPEDDAFDVNLMINIKCCQMVFFKNTVGNVCMKMIFYRLC